MKVQLLTAVTMEITIECQTTSATQHGITSQKNNN